MNEEQKAKNREAQRRYRAAHPELVAYKNFIYRQENRERIYETEKKWRAKNPERVAQHKKNQPRPPSRAKHNRKLYLTRITDKLALEKRLIARANAEIPQSLPKTVKESVTSMLLERVYSAEISVRFTAEDVRIALADYRREFEHFSFKHASLDAPVGPDKATLGQLAGVY